jgi:hypothetical protein
MTIEQTVEIPASRKIHLDFELPFTLPVGQARVEIKVSPAIVTVEDSEVPAAVVEDDAFGIWKDRDISLSTIREKAWKRR